MSNRTVTAGHFHFVCIDHSEHLLYSLRWQNHQNYWNIFRIECSTICVRYVLKGLFGKIPEKQVRSCAGTVKFTFMPVMFKFPMSILGVWLECIHWWDCKWIFWRMGFVPHCTRVNAILLCSIPAHADAHNIDIFHSLKSQVAGTINVVCECVVSYICAAYWNWVSHACICVILSTWKPTLNH